VVKLKANNNETVDTVFKQKMSESVDIAMLRRPQSIADVGKDFIALHHVFGTDISRRDNLSFIDDQTLAYVNGNCVIFENIWSRNRTYLLGIDDGGVGCIAVHPSRLF
jgi:hypothetical protein